MDDFRYLLDTNIVSEFVKNPQGRLAEKMLASGWEKYSCTSIIVACELRYGAAKKQSPKLIFNVEQVLRRLAGIAFSRFCGCNLCNNPSRSGAKRVANRLP